ncbi:hypothetical protein B0H11DRAFT_499086 [Mycena galericulata]|nr:hypothetical protein B0H11DRAFT_499086 [Mycena galericulata]
MEDVNITTCRTSEWTPPSAANTIGRAACGAPLPLETWMRDRSHRVRGTTSTRHAAGRIAVDGFPNGRRIRWIYSPTTPHALHSPGGAFALASLNAGVRFHPLVLLRIYRTPRHSITTSLCTRPPARLAPRHQACPWRSFRTPPHRLRPPPDETPPNELVLVPCCRRRRAPPSSTHVLRELTTLAACEDQARGGAVHPHA